MRRKQSENCFNYKRSKSSGRLKNWGKTTVFDWWREFRFGSKYREFKKKTESSRNRDSTVLHWLLWTIICEMAWKIHVSLNQKLHVRLIHCRPFAHDWPLNFPPEDETLINGSLEGMYSIVFACWNGDGAYKCLLCSSLTTDFSMQSCRNRIRIRFWFLSMSFRFYIFNFKLRNTKMYNLIAFYISNV